MNDSGDVKAQELKQIIHFLQVDAEGKPNMRMLAEKHNALAEHSASWIHTLRNRYHEIDGLLHSVNNLIKIVSKGHDELKEEQKLQRTATDNNTKEIARLVTIGQTTLFWFKAFIGTGILGVIGAATAVVFKIVTG